MTYSLIDLSWVKWDREHPWPGHSKREFVKSQVKSRAAIEATFGQSIHRLHSEKAYARRQVVAHHLMRHPELLQDPKIAAHAKAGELGPDVVKYLIQHHIKTDPKREHIRDMSVLAQRQIDLAITPGGRVGDASPLARPGYKGKRRLSDYEREIAHALMRKRGMPKRRAIAMARGLTNKAAATGRWGDRGKASAAVRAGAAASVAQRKTF